MYYSKKKFEVFGIFSTYQKVCQTLFESLVRTKFGFYIMCYTYNHFFHTVNPSQHFGFIFGVLQYLIWKWKFGFSAISRMPATSVSTWTGTRAESFSTWFACRFYI